MGISTLAIAAVVGIVGGGGGGGGGGGASGTINDFFPAGTSGNNESVTISIARRKGVAAPEAIWFDLAHTNFGQTEQHQIESFWDYGEDYIYSAPVNIYSEALRHASGNLNARYHSGPKGFHTFRSTGTKTVTVFSVNLTTGRYATGSLQVTIADPNVVFAGANTVYARASSSDFTGAPSGATTVTQSNFDTLWASQFHGQESTPKRLILGGGDTFTSSNGVDWGEYVGGSPSVLVTTNGGPQATVNFTHGSNTLFNFKALSSASGAAKSITFQNIIFSGTFSETNGSSAGSRECVFVRENPPGTTLFDKCTVSGFSGWFLDIEGGSFGGGYAFNDCILTKRGFGVLTSEHTFVAFAGCRIGPGASAVANTLISGGWNIRVSAPNMTFIAICNDMFNQTGQSSGGSPVTHFYQPNLRMNYNGDSGFYLVAQNHFEGNIQVRNSNGGADSLVSSFIEGNTFMGGHQWDKFILIGSPAATIRNNDFNVPNIFGHANANEFYNAIEVDGTNLATSLRNTPIRVYNNTMAVRDQTQPYAVPLLLNWNNAFTNVIVNNNVQYQPGPPGGPVSDGVLGNGTNYFTIRDDGFLSTTSDARAQTGPRPIAGNAPLNKLNAGSPAISGATTGLVSYVDMTQRRRTSIRPTPSRGAWE